MILSLCCIGIDVSKQALDIFEEAIGTPERIANTPEAIAERIARWHDRDVFVVFEATGVYDRTLTAALTRAGIRHARINPSRARDFARASGRLAKTDAIDARMLAAYARAMEPAADPATSPVRNTLASLVKRRDQLVHMRAQEKNRFSEEQDLTMIKRLRRHLDFLSDDIKAIEDEIQELVRTDPAITEEARLMRSAPGIAPVACMQLISQMPELGRLSPKQIAALAGLAPFNVDSGGHRGKRSIAGGRKRVRDALYMAALNAVRKNGPIKRFYDRLRAANKAAKLALIAVARKLLTVLNAMIRDRKTFVSTPAT